MHLRSERAASSLTLHPSSNEGRFSNSVKSSHGTLLVPDWVQVAGKGLPEGAQDGGHTMGEGQLCRAEGCLAAGFCTCPQSQDCAALLHWQDSVWLRCLLASLNVAPPLTRSEPAWLAYGGRLSGWHVLISGCPEGLGDARVECLGCWLCEVHLCKVQAPHWAYDCQGWRICQDQVV